MSRIHKELLNLNTKNKRNPTESGQNFVSKEDRQIANKCTNQVSASESFGKCKLGKLCARYHFALTGVVAVNETTKAKHR